jgi:hypothetical protein
MSDLFPAVVAVYPSSFLSGREFPYEGIGVFDDGGTRFTECRVIVHNNLLIVGADTARGAQMVFKAEVNSVTKEGGYTRVYTTNGDLVVFTPSKGCGCGSRLRSWNPYGNVVRSSRG